jgi:hypothetical protein
MLTEMQPVLVALASHSRVPGMHDKWVVMRLALQSYVL